VGDDWRHDVPYFDRAEASFPGQWSNLIWPLIHDADFTTVVDLAAGHGRNTMKLTGLARTLWVVDINEENIAFCRERFAGATNIHYLRTDGASLGDIADDSVTLLYCFDAMVHFDSEIVRAYLGECGRILAPDGRGFCHHSNFTGDPAGDLHGHGAWRNFMSQALFAHYCAKAGLHVLRARVVDWGGHEELDCLTLFEKPRETRGADVSPDASAETLVVMADEAAGRGDLAAAAALLERACRLQPDNGPFAVAHGNILMAMDRHPDALGELARASSLLPGQARPLALYARALLAVGRRIAARHVVSRALALGPGDDVALTVQKALEPR
jgi:SAM-dependent methyltransferase